MKNITNRKILKITTLCILIFVPFIKFFSMNLEMFNMINNYDNINPAIVIYISIPFLIFIYVKSIIDKKEKLDIYNYLLYILVGVGIISVIFSIDKNLAIFGKSFRHEGFLSILSYYLLFINWKIYGDKEDIKKFIKLIIIIGVINSIYALLQMYTNFDFVFVYNDSGKMASGLCGNPNFFGSLIITVLSIVTGIFLTNRKISFNYILLIILLFISLINSQSTGPFLAYIITLLFLIIFFLIKKYKILRKSLLLIIILIFTYIFIFFINDIFVVDKTGNNSNKCEICISSIKQTTNTGGNGRLKIWGNSLKIVKENLLIGVGFDNFYLAYPNPKIDNSLKLVVTNGNLSNNKKLYHIVDTAHNVYLHTLVSTGILGLIPYLLLCLLVFIKGSKSNNKLVLILSAGFIAYSVQAFSNISVIQVAPIYYIIMGLILISEKEIKRGNYK